MNIGFVFTNFNNSHFTLQAVASLLQKQQDSHHREIVVVDNASNAKEVEELRECAKQFPQVTYIWNDENVGYFRGLNLGIHALRNRPESELDCLVVGNNDLVFPPSFGDQVASISHLIDMYPVIAPDIITLDGEHQNPHVAALPSRKREYLWDLYYSSYPLAKIMSWFAARTRRTTGRTDHHTHDRPQAVFQGYGACYLLTPAFFRHFNDLWSPTFLMGEEFFLSQQLAEKGFPVYYVPDVKVLHHDHATTNKVPGEKLWRFGRDAHLLYREHYKPELFTKILQADRSSP